MSAKKERRAAAWESPHAGTIRRAVKRTAAKAAIAVRDKLGYSQDMSVSMKSGATGRKKAEAMRDSGWTGSNPVAHPGSGEVQMRHPMSIRPVPALPDTTYRMSTTRRKKR